MALWCDTACCIIFNALYTVEMKKVDVFIAGAGAAGLFCAIEAGRRGRHVVVVDHANKAGKKILMSGGGRCNFTNRTVSHENFQSASPHYCRSALSQFTANDFIQRVDAAGIPYHEKKLGQLFCDRSSKDIVQMLLQDCQQNNVDIRLSTSIDSIEQVGHKAYVIKTSQGAFSAQSVVIATGGLSIPTMGASPFGYRIAEQFGLAVMPLRAGLVPFTLHDKDKLHLETLSGVSLPAIVRCGRVHFEEDVLFTHRGLSGPACLQISSYWQPGETIIMNLLPQIDLFTTLLQLKSNTPNQSLKTALSAWLPNRLVSVWLSDRGKAMSLQSYSNAMLQQLSQLFQQWPIQPNNTEGYRTAEVTLGGVDVNALSSKTGEVKSIPGLYFIGEVVDVTGMLGGYNFQWAWSSGYVAGLVV